MFERIFQWGLRNGTRLLFGATLVVLAAGLLHAVAGAFAFGPQQSGYVLFGKVFGAVHDAAWPFFATLVVHWLETRSPAPPVATTPGVPPWLVRNGGYLLLGVSVLFLGSAAINFVLWLRDLGSPGPAASLYAGSWLAPLWSASVLFAGALLLLRLNARL
jgi:hypothetical protein